MLSEDKLKELLFPHNTTRKTQDAIITEVENTLNNKKNLLMHAPTGLGKTAATLPIALSYALKNKKTVFFLTSRHTQHKIVIDTLKEIKQKYDTNFDVADIIGKKWMCLVPGVQILFTNEFNEYCKKQREEDKCEYYTNIKTKNGKLGVEAKYLLEKLQQQSPSHNEDLIKTCAEHKMCPYEMSTLIAAKAKVIVADYYYIFNPKIRDSFFNKTQKTLEESIIIVDEGHNLGIRVRELMTQRLTNMVIHRAIKEAKKYQHDDIILILEEIKNILEEMRKEITEGNETIITKDEFMQKIENTMDYDELITKLEDAGDDIREKQKQSSTATIATFLEEWKGEDEGYARILSITETKTGQLTTLSYRCLDPSIVTKPLFEQAYSTIVMSGTLKPTQMYKDLLGMPENTELREYKNIFPKHNKLTLIVPETTTKFTKRDENQYKKIAEITAEICNTVPGNSAVFFPSYQIRDAVNRHFSRQCKKTTFLEESGLSKEEKTQLLENFKRYKDSGAALLGVAAGSFGEGIDLPGDFLKAVIVVGLPLSKPDLETQQLIQYYDKKFNKGWDYGYITPAMNKCLQSAGRCIRTETDRGVIIFLDERFTWPNYYKNFPEDSGAIIDKNYKKRIEEFFNTK